MRDKISSPMCWVLLLLTVSHGLRASEETDPQAQEGQLPSLELLEFLGSFETDEGDWINPIDLVEIEFGLLLETALEDSDENESGNLNAKSGSN